MRKLFESFSIRNLTIHNRIAVPPMVVYNWSNDTGAVTGRQVQHYQEMAAGGVGLIIQEGTCVEQDGRLTDTQLGIWEDRHIEGLRKITEAVHQQGTPIILQLHHGGVFGFMENTLCPSDITCIVRGKEYLFPFSLLEESNHLNKLKKFCKTLV